MKQKNVQEVIGNSINEIDTTSYSMVTDTIFSGTVHGILIKMYVYGTNNSVNNIVIKIENTLKSELE